LKTVSHFLDRKTAHNLKTTGQILMQFHMVTNLGW